MPFGELLPGQVVTDQFLVEFPGIDDRIAVGLPCSLEYFPEGDGGQRYRDLEGSSLRESVGVPDLILKAFSTHNMLDTYYIRVRSIQGIPVTPEHCFAQYFVQ